MVDDTAYLQACTAAAVRAGREFTVPPGEYHISDTVTIPRGNGWGLRGYGATIVQDAPNLPILRFTQENTWGFRVEGLTFSYAATPAATDTGSIALAVDPETANGWGVYNFALRDLTFTNPRAGLAQAATSTAPVWGARLEGFIGGAAMTGPVISLKSSIGQPNNAISSFYARRDNALTPAIDLTNVDTVTMRNIEVNHVTGTALRIVTSTGVIEGLRAETGTLATDFEGLVALSNCDLRITATRLQSLLFTGRWGSALRVTEGGKVTLDGVSQSSLTASTKGTSLLSCGTAGRVNLSRLTVRDGSPLTATVYPYDDSPNRVVVT